MLYNYMEIAAIKEVIQYASLDKERFAEENTF
jgi:hypothetical protein